MSWDLIVSSYNTYGLPYSILLSWMGRNRVILYYSLITVFHFTHMRWDLIVSSYTSHTVYRIPFYLQEMGDNRVILNYSHINAFHFTQMRWDLTMESCTSRTKMYSRCLDIRGNILLWRNLPFRVCVLMT